MCLFIKHLGSGYGPFKMLDNGRHGLCPQVGIWKHPVNSHQRDSSYQPGGNAIYYLLKPLIITCL